MQAVGEQAKLINAALPFVARPLRLRAAVHYGRRRSRPPPRFAVPYPGDLLRGGLRAGRRASRGCPGRSQPPAPSGFPKSVCGVVYQGAGGASASSPSYATAHSIARRSSGPGARPNRSRARPLPAMSRPGRRSHTLSRRLCHAALGAAAREGRPDRPAYLLSLARRLGTAAAFTGRYIGEPRDPAVDAPAAAGDQRRRHGRTSPRVTRARRSPAPRRRRRPARHDQGLDAEYSGP